MAARRKKKERKKEKKRKKKKAISLQTKTVSPKYGQKSNNFFLIYSLPLFSLVGM